MGGRPGKGQLPSGLVVLGEWHGATTRAVSGLLGGFTENNTGAWSQLAAVLILLCSLSPADEQGVERLEAQAQLPLRWTQQLPDPAKVPAGRRVSSLVPEAWGASSGRPH